MRSVRQKPISNTWIGLAIKSCDEVVIYFNRNLILISLTLWRGEGLVPTHLVAESLIVLGSHLP